MIIKGKIEDGYREPGRRNMSWLQNIRQWTELETHEFMIVTDNRQIEMKEEEEKEKTEKPFE